MDKESVGDAGAVDVVTDSDVTLLIDAECRCPLALLRPCRRVVQG
jgi:hypothetical protein